MSTIADLEAAGLPIKIDVREPFELTGDSVNGWESKLTFIVPFGQPSDEFISIVAGTPTTIRLPGGTSVTRIIPLIHPTYKWLIAQNLTCKAFGGQSDQSSYSGGIYGSSCWSHNRIQITFRSLNYSTDISGGETNDGSQGDTPFLSIDMDDSTEYITMPGNSFKFPSDNTPIKQDAGFSVPTTVYQITVYQCNSLGDDVITPLKGCVNSDVFLGKAAGTVRLDGYKTSVQIGIAGVMSYTRTFTLTYRAVPHNLILRPNGQWEAPVNSNTGGTIYQSADLSQAFV